MEKKEFYSGFGEQGGVDLGPRFGFPSQQQRVSAPVCDRAELRRRGQWRSGRSTQYCRSRFLVEVQQGTECAAGFRSERFLEKMLVDLKSSLSPALSGFVDGCRMQHVAFKPDPLFHTVLGSPSCPLAEEEQPGRLLSVHNLTELHFHAPEKKQLYHLCVKFHCSPSGET
ncbi:UNVERIFIED_CONTAM: hypothetical protein FKN15_019208 [Acipenser sinensis]